MGTYLRLILKNALKCALAATLLGLTQAANAIEMNLASTDAVVDKAKFTEVVTQFLPAKVQALDSNYRLIGVMETASYRDGERFFYYSLMLHKKVIDRDSGKTYWAVTGGIRAHGITAGGEELIKHVREDLVLGANSFPMDQ
ncbi:MULTISPECIES: hypothetical protein [Cupriavidus]|uniref:Uncharacterized protein n=2 Tax=Cupriavidus TaxID=106589 RepID=A0A3G8GVW2_9BURK|nr:MULTISPECIES: hypothetical protein [Cupriavidus]AZG12105.1 hypothetical protein EHF44_01095 [Cupriavidus pauculus]QBP14380.1 hypothetical protein DDF84_032165 [Cupriavidus metallidurans]